ncbi:MAG: bifunctional DNA-formamidopyrimidine glycosylase/DNA-(apurinic or apyrimidinic site) lyase [Anaerolineales bacterium]
MPELPEVETIARGLRQQLLGRTVLAAELLWARTLATPGPKKFKRRLLGQQINGVGRRAKYLHLQLSEDHLFFHLRMSGDLHVKTGTPPAQKHDRLILSLSGDLALVFNDTRKFGRVWLVTDPAQVIAHLGPEPLSEAFTAQEFYTALQARHRQLKPLLLDQSFLAGMGNIYTDEALHMARIHPQSSSDSLGREQVQRLYEAIRTILKEGIRRNGSSIDWVYRGGEFQNYFRVYDRKGQPCPVCGVAVQRIVVGQRGTYMCPSCQPRE